MAEYIAIRDCVYGFKFIRKGKKVVGDLADNENFEPVSAADGKKETPASAPKAKEQAKTAADPKEVAIRLRAKELKINNWHTKGVDKLVEEIAEIEKDLAGFNQQPDSNSPVGQAPEGDKQPDGNKKPDENAGK